jgi:acyl carrier protein
MNYTEAAARVREYIEEHCLYMRPGFTFTDADPLLGLGIIDSMGVIELVEFVQDELGVIVQDDDLTEANLGSVAAIANYVSGKRVQQLAS